MTSFFSKLKAEAEKLWKEAPKVESVALVALNAAAPEIEAIAGLVEGAAGEAAVTAILNQIKVDFTVAAATLSDAGPNPTVVSALSAVQANLPQIDEAAHIVNPASQQKLGAALSLVTTEISDVSTALTPAPSTTAAASPAIIGATA